MNDSSSYATIALGIVAACLTTGCWIPQAIQTIRTRRADDFAWSYMALFGGGVFLWALYGIVRRDPAVVAANAVTLLLVARIAVVKATGR